ncbi:MAG: putative toxin-antitoxin system toxin component, PIN family [Anaerolineaceae bacterium]|nr:putative toxin-antitoxin system toxin component, PIN family [Anaerolineaceae bacterium]MCB9102594.1 putative toxin-antitoxin system toxin component, PIN family [Anaerolineales bacterium]
MPTEPHFVFDTNALISALLLKNSVSRQAFDEALKAGKILISSATIAELNDVLKREKFEKYITEEERVQFLTAFVREAKLVEVTETVTDCRDPKDNKFLELAVSGNAVCIVSGDKDLLDLQPFRGIPIVPPREFLNLQWLE